MEREPTTEILEATYRALCEHGYAALTLQDIAAESEKSKAAIHYHYDTKDELFSTFLEYLYERYAERIDSAGGETPVAHLRSLLAVVLLDDDGTPRREYQTAILEVKAQAPYDDAIQSHLAEFDAFLFDRLRDIVEAGVESGDFDGAVDPAFAAEFLVTTIKGAQTRRVAVDRDPEQLYEAATRYVETHLVASELVEGAN